MKIKSLLKIVVFLLVLSSCKKAILEVNPNYEGEWHTASEVLDSGREIESFFIVKGDSAIYAERCDVDPMGTNCSVYHIGKVLTTKSQKKMFIGDQNKDVQLFIIIDTPPHLNADGKWECELMSRVYIKK